MGTHDTFDARRLFDLRGKSAIVTGAASGIGRVIAEGLASVGVLVVAADILHTIRETERAITACGQKCMAVQTDLGNPADRAGLVKQAIEARGKVDILVNCAGITRGAPSETYPDQDWEQTLNINLTAIFHLCKLVAADMIRRRSGIIINVSSIGGALGFPNNPAYQASKGGVSQLTRALATDWAKYNIRVNNLCPGYTVTPMTKPSFENSATRAARASRTMLNRWADPRELVGPVIFLASEASSYVTGNDLFVDGGWGKSGLTDFQ
jgi:NAD(P)-dependent dehydrogenase (short-subunit alcohol dehydrogenase family)